MKNHLVLLISLFVVFSGLSLEAKNYTRKAVRPAASDHTWQDYDYNFNLDENGNLTGTNTFSKVYNASPTRWKNTGYYGEGVKMYTGYETLTITVLPGNDNYKYTISTNVVEWQWDTHLLKWVKRRSMPTNGTRTFSIKDGKLNGAFEIPVIASPFGITFVYGNARNGVIPNGQTMRWKFFDYTQSTPQPRMEIKSEGNETEINVLTYLVDVKKIEVEGSTGLGKFGENKSGYYIELSLPLVKCLNYELPLLLAVASIANIGTYKLEKYTQIPLPDIYYDNYVDPYKPLTTILDNGHKLTSTRQRNGAVYTKESWEEDGYAYVQEYDGEYHPAIGRKVVGDTIFIHYKKLYSKNSNAYERGYITQNAYYPIEYKYNSEHSTFDYSHAYSDGYIVIKDNAGQHYAYFNEGENRPKLKTYKVESYRHPKFAPDYKYEVFKEVNNEGVTTVPAELTDELNRNALDFLKFVNHPYVKQLYPTDYTVTEITMTPSGAIKINYNQQVPVKKNVPKKYPNSFKIGRGNNNPAVEKKNYEEYYLKMMNIMHSPQNPLKELQASIAMELDLPDYDLIVDKKIKPKTIGKRTAKLLKELPKLLNQKLGEGKNLWPNAVKKAFLKNNENNDFKEARVSRIVKAGKDVSVYVVTSDFHGQEKETVLKLEDNIPVDEYFKVWKLLAEKTK